MRVALLAVLASACSSAPKAAEPTPPGTAAAAAPAAAGATPAAATASAGTSTMSAAKAAYSCFSYVSKNSTTTRHACMRSDDCAPYLEQARAVGGIRELSGCAAAPTVHCFHQVGTADEPDGLDVCQPTLEECKTARTDVVRAKMAVDTDCAVR